MADKELRTPCQCCGDTIASGLWRIIRHDGHQSLKFLCARCGFTEYARRYSVFGKKPTVRLVKTLGTKFVQHKATPPADADKHWVERPVVPERTINGKPVSQILAEASRRPPSVPDSIRRGLRDHQ